MKPLYLTSRQFRTNLEREYLRRICDLPIQPREFANYLESGPVKIGNLAITPISAEAYVRVRTLNDYRTVMRCIVRRGNIECFNTNDFTPIDRVHRVFISRGYDPKEYDLFTTGNILLRRLNCRRIDPNYVQNRLLALLEMMEIRPTDDVNTQIRKNLWIRMNAKIFGVNESINSILLAIERWLENR